MTKRGELCVVGEWTRFKDRAPVDRQRVVYRLRRGRLEFFGRWSAKHRAVLFGEKVLGEDCCIEPLDNLRDWKAVLEVHG